MPVSVNCVMICADSLRFDALSGADANKYVSVITLGGTSHHSLMLWPGGSSEQVLHRVLPIARTYSACRCHLPTKEGCSSLTLCWQELDTVMRGEEVSRQVRLQARCRVIPGKPRLCVVHGDCQASTGSLVHLDDPRAIVLASSGNAHGKSQPRKGQGPRSQRAGWQ